MKLVLDIVLSLVQGGLKISGNIEYDAGVSVFVTDARTLIGKTINGVKITHYGYPGDSTPDSNSMKGIGDRDNKLVSLHSVALTHSQRQKLFNVTNPSTGKHFDLGGVMFFDDDTAPESDDRVDIYDPFYTGRDPGNTDEMFAKNRSEMVKAGILT